MISEIKGDPLRGHQLEKYQSRNLLGTHAEVTELMVIGVVFEQICAVNQEDLYAYDNLRPATYSEGDDCSRKPFANFSKRRLASNLRLGTNTCFGF